MASSVYKQFGRLCFQLAVRIESVPTSQQFQPLSVGDIDPGPGDVVGVLEYLVSMVLYSGDDLGERGGIQQKVTCQQVCWGANFPKNSSSIFREFLDIVSGELGKHVPGVLEGRAAGEDVGDVIDGIRAEVREKTDSSLVLGPVTAQGFSPVSS